MSPSILVNAINLTLPKVIKRANQFILKSPTCFVDDILDQGFQSCVVHHDDLSLLAMVNNISLPQITLHTFLNFDVLMCFGMDVQRMI